MSGRTTVFFSKALIDAVTLSFKVDTDVSKEDFIAVSAVSMARVKERSKEAFTGSIADCTSVVISGVIFVDPWRSSISEDKHETSLTRESNFAS